MQESAHGLNRHPPWPNERAYGSCRTATLSDFARVSSSSPIEGRGQRARTAWDDDLIADPHIGSSHHV